MKFLKALIGILLLPLCAGGAVALFKVLSQSARPEAPTVMLLCGVACWLVLFWLLPKPMWLYVVGHELTHALWTWLFGGKVKKIKATSQGGHVIITKSNFLISLAPYFFPFYAACVALVFFSGSLIWNWSRFSLLFHLLLGAAYGFHVTLTAHILQTRQTDITDHGWIFSCVIIWLGNVAVLVCALPILTGTMEVGAALKLWLNATIAILRWLVRFKTG